MELENIRREINNIDDALVDLFKKRMNCSAMVAEYKKQNSKAIFDKSRERSIVARLTEDCDEQTACYINALYNTIFEVSRSLQSSMIYSNSDLMQRIANAKSSTSEFLPTSPKVACQGVEGAYSTQACDRLFPRGNIVYSDIFENVFEKVISGQCDYGILPLENSLHGSVWQVYDLLKKYQNKVYIVKSVKIPIHHVLVAKPGVKKQDIRQVYSHQQAIGQCSHFLSENPQINVNISTNTALAAKFISESDNPEIAAISSAECAELYGLEIIDRDIQNSDNNHTRFICISSKMEIYPSSTKLSVMFSVPHRPGGLFSILARFNILGISLTKLESRPIEGRDFEFLFYAEMDLNGLSPDLLSFLSELDSKPEEFVFLGNYSEV